MSSNVLFTARGVAHTFQKYTKGIPSRTLLVFCHANGFCKEVWSPVIASLGKHATVGFDVIALDLTGHGQTTRSTNDFCWYDLSRDILSCVAARLRDNNNYNKIFGIGHSIGAMAVIQAEILLPGTFDGLMAIEPIIPPPSSTPMNSDSALVRSTLKRRAQFESKNSAFARWSSKKAFQRWQPEALRAYVDGGLVQTCDGFTLRCAPVFEAKIFAGTTDTYENLSSVTSPTLLVGGAESNHLRAFEVAVGEECYLQHLSKRLPNSYPCQILPGCTHFVPMEIPDKIASMIAEHFLPSTNDRHPQDTLASRL